MPRFWRRAGKMVVPGLVALCASLSWAGGGSADVPASQHLVHTYRSLIPLGSEVFLFSQKDSREIFYVMASAQDREFEGQQVWMDGNQHILKTAKGVPVENYPHQVHFRVSVSERDGFMLVDPPLPIETHARTFDQFISGLKFEMRIFHALKNRIVHPSAVAHIGIPPDVPASERVYEVTFDLGEVPITDRVVMHVLTDQGDRLAKFNVDLY